MTDTHQTEPNIYIYINSTAVLQSLLFDLNLLPEQLEEDSPNWDRMLCIVWHFQEFERQLKND
jgi:hypothetical protein